MKVIVVGCGKVGYTLIEQLNAEEEHEITVVDNNKSKLDDISAKMDVMTYLGDGTSYTTLLNAGIESADILIAVMNSDETNLLCCVIAKKTGRCRTIARVRNPIYSNETVFLKRELDLAMVINPELAAAEEISRLFLFPYATKIDVFANSKVELVHFKIPQESKLSNLKIADIRAKYKCNALICMVTRNDEVMIPGGDFVLQDNDIIGIIATPKNANEFFQLFCGNTKRITNTMIVGGGKIGYYLATKLINSGINVKIIENDRNRCEFLSELLPDADIINGDGTDKGLLLEEGLSSTASFAALTSIDEENILLSLFANGRGPRKTVTKVNRINFDEVISQLNLDSIIYPNRITTDFIIQYVRSMKYTMGNNIENYRKIGGGKAEALEFVVRENSAVTDTELSKLKIKKNMLICCINRRGKIIIPGGNDTIEVGDSVVVASSNQRLLDINDILEK